MALVLSPPQFDHGNKLDEFLRADEARNQFVNDLARENVALHTRIAELEADHEAAQLSRRQFQNLLLQTKADLRTLSDDLKSHETVLVILDGDGAIFLDDFYRQGRVGGRNAATAVQQCVKQALRDRFPEQDTTHWHIVVHLILNERGLASTLRTHNVIAQHELLKDFGHGWVSLPNFFWTDSGAGKDSADCRVTQLLHFNMTAPSCKKLFFGPCSDTGYRPQLERYCSDSSQAQKITLIEARPAEFAFRALGLPIMTMREVFRQDNLDDIRTQISPRVNYSSVVVGIAPVPNREGVPGRRSPPIVLPTTIRTQAVGSSSSEPTSGKPQQQAHDIYYNAAAQRLDLDLPAPTAGAEARFEERIRSGKLCNTFQLLGRCEMFSKPRCDYQHVANLPADEVLVLQHKARGLPCRLGSSCDDHSCISGHRCKFGPHCASNGCRFAPGMHLTDVVPAKMLRQGSTMLEDI